VHAHPLPDGRAEGAARKTELADIFCVHAEGIRSRAPLQQRRVIDAIQSCRTAALGGHLERCDQCHAERAVYHSCRNRHCPKCQTLAKERWLEARRADLLPIEYFHVVFTLPHALHPLVQRRSRLVYDLLFQSASATLQSFGRDPKHLGGQIGITAILHTWGQNLSQHVHLHCIVTGGGLSPDGSRFLPARRGFLFPVRALSKVFRGKFLAGLKKARERRELPQDLRLPMDVLQGTPWVVYAKPSFGRPQAVLDYLGRYTHRVAISNDRIVALREGVVHFRWRDYADGNQNKVMQLGAGEFIRRFLLHVLPHGFVRIRHFGLLAHRHRRAQLERCRALLEVCAPALDPDSQESTAQRILRRTGVDILRCPACTLGRMHPVAVLPSRPPRPQSPDTS
jgi:hypothetical protein